MDLRQDRPRIFPAEVRYVDLGSPTTDCRESRRSGETSSRVKATVRNFSNETNIFVITEDGSSTPSNVRYAANRCCVNVEMCDFIMTAATVNRPNNAQEILLKELGSESPCWCALS
ncbi:DUF4138 domain-containing protein [Bacteroides acidifaciens]|uniref:DUF4138 domain-containing protein n=1 Tax=Bacteroides acidifaciens TaxID=85831 RepID=UPI003F693460